MRDTYRRSQTTFVNTGKSEEFVGRTVLRWAGGLQLINNGLLPFHPSFRRKPESSAGTAWTPAFAGVTTEGATVRHGACRGGL